MEFKLIAIRPLENCNPDFLRILDSEQSEPYYFYRDYIIHNDDAIELLNEIPNELFNVTTLNNEIININISAISGKNGSGKSSIIELLFAAINNIAKVLNKKNSKANLEYINDIRVDFFFKTDYYYKASVYDNNVAIYKFQTRSKKNKHEIILKDISQTFMLSNFFYTVAVNYSHYAYNTKDMGTWLNGLFHKNDAYQTPLVLNPMRDEGNFDINIENDLAKARLISNLIRPSNPKNKYDFKAITDVLQAEEFAISLNKSKKEKVLYEIIDEKDIKKESKVKNIKRFTINNSNIVEDVVFKKLNKYYKFNYDINSKNKFRLVFDYLIYKLVSISLTYSDYDLYYDKNTLNFNENLLDEYLQKLLIEDESHITFKIKQTLNYLKFNHIELKNQKIRIEELSNIIEVIRNSNKNIKIKRIELLPPPVFKMDINLKLIEKGKKIIPLKSLSSGEKQMIYSVSSILYHLINLDSVKNSKTKTAYKFVNIILEEIELYFHPEMQRTYIDFILKSIENIELKNIKSINFCFVSHSPFILSDIPNKNIMFLKVKNNKSNQVIDVNQTFGANIHDLLKDGFFMEKGSVGEFAKNEINKIIKWLNDTKINIENLNQINQTEIETYKKLIEIIDEPIIKSKLLQMFFDIFIDDREELIKLQIEKLSNEIGYEVSFNKIK